jgi:shikimate kinase
MGEKLNSRTIVLVGPKHSGKTSAGHVLAALLTGEFIDLDASIKDQTGKSPRALYQAGPEFFKKAEALALERLLRRESRKSGDMSPATRRIIAAGGGIADNPGAMALLQKPGGPLLICLDLDAETAWDRIRREAQAGEGLPPFLDTDDPQDTHRRLHDRRAAAYRDCAHITIAAGGKSPEAIGREIINLLEKRGE